MSDPIRVRLPPSPTGLLHVGSARTFIFNWLYARGRAGRVVLRFEDTDRERSTDGAIEQALRVLGWLGEFIFRGIAMVDNSVILAGAIPAALMALVADLSLSGVEKLLARRRG